MIFNSKWFENSRIDGFAVLEIVVNSGDECMFVPLARTHLDARIDGPLGDFTLSQTFRYSRDVNPSTIEALYRFPLPGDAAVLDVEVRFGDVAIHAALKSRADAESEYNAAKKEEKAAVLMTRESPDVFTLNIAGIVPDEDVVIRTHYIQMGMPDQRGYSFRIPLTTAPRYVRGDERYSRHAKGQPLAILRNPGHRFSLDITSGGTGVLRSPTHTLVTSQKNRITLSGGDVIPDRDCILVWDPASHGTVPTCLVFTDSEQESHFLALVSPPDKSPIRLPRDVIILVDHSGSMDGPKREAADWAVERFISGLIDKDRFNLCLFESDSYWLSGEPGQATNTFKGQAIAFLRDTRSGGTELGVALEQALSQSRHKGAVARHVIIITDGEVTDSGRIFRLVDVESGKKDSRRCNILCIDSAPNSYFAQQVAERGGGIAKFLTSSPEEDDITSALDEILSYWDAPVAVGLGLAVNRSGLLVDQRKVRKCDDGRSLIDLGDLPSGKSQWVVARAEPSDKRISFELTGLDPSASIISETTSPAVRALFGARLVAELESLMHAGYTDKEITRNLMVLGYDPDNQKARSKESVYAENRMKGAMNRVKDLIIVESLRYGVLSSETAFVAIREEKGRKVEERVIVPTALPSGWSDSFQKSWTKAVFMPKASPRRRSEPSGGSIIFGYQSAGVLEWVGGGGDGMICQPDGTMKMEKRRVPSPAITPGAPIVTKTVQSPRHGEDTIEAGKTPEGYLLFSGRPVFTRNESVLFDSSIARDAKSMPEKIVLKKVKVKVKDWTYPVGTGIFLLLYVGDPLVPRVKVSVKDLLQHPGGRPLNICRMNGELLKIVLIDPDGGWETDCPEIKVMIG
jgi:Ca-activated chloride channel family protein